MSPVEHLLAWIEHEMSELSDILKTASITQNTADVHDKLTRMAEQMELFRDTIEELDEGSKR